MTSKILGCGGYLPQRVLSNAELEGLVSTTDEWIQTRTGISQRHIAAENEYASHMALKAAENAISDAKISLKDIDLIMVCTTTPDNSFPSTATKLQGYLGLGSVPSFDFQTVCSGFIYGLHIADSLLASDKYKTILFVCSEKMSALVDWQDRSTCVLFGDGAGAVILQRDNSNSGIIDSKIYSDGSYYDILYTNGGVSLTGTSGKIQMNGREVFKNAVEKMSESLQEILVKNNMKVDDIDYFIPHQANVRIIENVAERLNLNKEKLILTVSKHANCSAASIPLALESLKASGKLKTGNIIAFTAFGAGLTWGSALIRW